jgi:hypothetical protein
MKFHQHVGVFQVQPCKLSCLVLVRKLSGITVAHLKRLTDFEKSWTALMPLLDESVSVSAVVHSASAWRSLEPGPLTRVRSQLTSTPRSRLVS